MLAREVPSKIYRYHSVSSDACLKNRSVKLAPETLSPCDKNVTFLVGEIVSTSPRTMAYSPAAPAFGQNTADLALKLVAHESKNFNKLQFAWLGILCSHKHRIAVQLPDSPDWLLPLHPFAPMEGLSCIVVASSKMHSRRRL